MGFDVNLLRAEEFPWTLRTDGIYLNNAGMGPLPRSTIDTLHQWASACAEPWRVKDDDVVFPALMSVRARCAELIRAQRNEIALVPNTSFGLNLAARSLPLVPGDVVLSFDNEFPSLIYTWRAVERMRGIRLRLLPTSGGLPNVDVLWAALDEPRTRVVAVSWVSFASGYKIDIRRLGSACRERGIYLVVDAMQGLGPATLDMGTCDVDIVACGGYKWLLSPWGTAFVYVRQSIIGELIPPVVGWFVGPASEDYTRLLDYDLTYFDSARRFEVMTLPSHDLVAMGQSLALLLELGPQNVEAHVVALTSRIVTWAQELGARLVTPSDPEVRAGIVSLAIADTNRVSRRLQEARIWHSVREGAIRLSPYVYNTADEIERVLNVLETEI